MVRHSIAQYPTSFKGTVVSPTKICLQFEDVEAKLRFMEGAEYMKLPDTYKALPISVNGTSVDVSAVGCQMPTIEVLQAELLQAYLKYGRLYSQTYEEVYEGRKFIDFIERTVVELTRISKVLRNKEQIK